MQTPAPMGTFRSSVFQFDRSNISVSHGVRAAILAVLPTVVGVATGNFSLIYVTLGACFLTMTEGSNSARLPLAPLLVACVAEPIAFYLGTLTGLTGLTAIPLTGLAIFVFLLLELEGVWALVGSIAAVFFAVGVGLPGGSDAEAVTRLVFTFAGCLLAFGGAWIHRALTDRAHAGFELEFPKVKNRFHSDTFRDIVAVSIASALGLAIGIGLHLPRDYWIVITILIVSRPRILPTVSLTTSMIFGTLIGAAIGAVVAVEISNASMLELILLILGILLFSTRGVNLGLTQLFLAPFIIIVINLLYPGNWLVAAYRVIDVAIGGAIATATIYAGHQYWRWRIAPSFQTTTNPSSLRDPQSRSSG